MGQLEDLQRNRIVRMQNLQKGFCGDDNQDDLFKAHMDGDIHPNGKWMWVSSANGGKGDWRTIPKDGKRSQDHQPQPKPATQQGGSGIIDSRVKAVAVNYVNENTKGDSDHLIKQQIARMVIAGKDKADIATRVMSEFGVKSSAVFDSYYDFGHKLASDALDIAKKKIADKDKGKPDFSPKYPSEISSLNRQSSYDKFKQAKIKLGEDIAHDKMGDDKKAILQAAKENIGSYYANNMSDADILDHYYYRLAERYMSLGKNPSNTAEISAMKEYYETKARAAERDYKKKKNDEYWAGSGAARKQTLVAERAKLLEERQKREADMADEVKKAFPYSSAYEVEVTIPDSFHADGRISFKRSRGSWGDVEISFKNKNMWSTFKDPSKENDIKYVPEINMSSQRTEFDGGAEFERTKFTITMAAEFMKDGVADEWTKKISEAAKSQRAARKRIDEINTELNADHSDD